MRTRGSRVLVGYRRTAVVGAASAAFLLAGLGPAQGAPAAPAQDAPAFSNGQAKATALVTKVAPGVGSLELALGSGIAVSELRNSLAQAQAQSFDLGLIGTTLTAEGCSGNAPLTADQLPQATRVDNREGDTELTTDEGAIAGENLGAGRETAKATKAPSATAVATTLASTTPLFTISGGEATAVTEVVDGAARQARASVKASLSIAGLVELGSLQWDALHRTGKDPQANGTFSIGSAQLGGVPLPLEDLAVLQDAINTGLAPTGVIVELPRVERIEEPTDLVRVTPLRISLVDSELGATAAGPLLNATRAQREQMVTELSAAICEAAGLLLVADIGVSIVSGTGFLVTEIGGVEALSGDFDAGDPFGDVPMALADVIPPASGSAFGGGFTPATPGSVAAPPVAAPPAGGEATRPVAAIGPLEELCETVHPLRSPGCSEGAMLPLGLLGLVATGAVGALDWQHQRRRAAALAKAVPA